MDGKKGMTRVSSGKKLVQAQLPFLTKSGEPPKKKIACTAKDETENSENIDINSAEVVVVCDNDLTAAKMDTEEMVDNDVKKKKRESLDEGGDSKLAKKPKLDIKSKLSIFSRTPLKSDKQALVEKQPIAESKTIEEIVIEDSTSPMKNKLEATTFQQSSAESKVETVINDCKGSPSKETVEPTTVPLNVEEKETPPSQTSVSGSFDMDTTMNDTATDLDTSQVSDVIDLDEDGQKEASSSLMTPPNKLSVARKKTPKQQDAVRKREEKERLKQEKELKRQQEKEEKELKKQQEKEEKLKLKEEKELQRKKELEEKEEQKRKAKEDKEKKKQQEIEMKLEEKKRKEEEKKRKEEELQRKKEEEAASQKNKFAKEAAVFSNFFTKVDLDKSRKSEGVVETFAEVNLFKPFTVKNRMRLAVINRNPLTEERRVTLDNALLSQDVMETYVTQLRCGEIKPGTSGSTWPFEEIYQDEDNDVEEITPSVAVTNPRAKQPKRKLLQFAENRRPPYWGTWRKKCPGIGARKPFGTYKEFDYEVDSDEEWEEEEPGESLHGSDDEKDKEEQDDEDDYDIDDMFVPHGYLSEDEAPADETWNVEQQKEKLKLLGEQFVQERQEKTRQLRPIVLGCIWIESEPETVLSSIGNKKLASLLMSCKPWLADGEPPIVIGGTDDPDSPDGKEEGPSPVSSARKGLFPEEAIPALIAKTHGAIVRRRAIAKDFTSFWSQENPHTHLTIAAVSRKVKQIAQYQECPDPPMQGRMCWYVSKEIRDQYGCSDLQLPTPATKAPVENVEADTAPLPKITKFTKVLTEEERRLSLKAAQRPNNDLTPEVTDCDNVNKITKFAKVLSEDERRQSLKTNRLPEAEKDVISTTCAATVEKAVKKLSQFKAEPEKPKKRVAILFSAPRGTPIVRSSSSQSADAESKDNAQEAKNESQNICTPEDSNKKAATKEENINSSLNTSEPKNEIVLADTKSKQPQNKESNSPKTEELKEIKTPSTTTEPMNDGDSTSKNSKTEVPVIELMDIS